MCALEAKSERGDPRIQKILCDLDGRVNYLQGSLGDLVEQLTFVRVDLEVGVAENSDVHSVQSPMADQLDLILSKVRVMCYQVQDLMKSLEV